MKTENSIKDPLDKRASGVLCHIASLNSNYGIGDLGENAYEFADFLHDSGQVYWQILPLNPTYTFSGNSPYSSTSGFAGNPLFISPDILFDKGLLSKSDLEQLPQNNWISYDLVHTYKTKILKKAFENYGSDLDADHDFKEFCSKNSFWLDDYSLFISLKEHFSNKSWNNYPENLRNRLESEIAAYSERLYERIHSENFYQYLFYTQWHNLKKYCNERNILIIGDIPYYVNYDSSDVWANQEIFKLDEKGNPLFVSGVPPDYFSNTGQLWGNPVYDWEEIESRNFKWWTGRLKHNFELFDIVRLDHFRAFVSYWEIKAGEKTAVNGTWEKIPTEKLFNYLKNELGTLNFIAEDLGTITPDVIWWRDELKLPGMNILQFAFGDDYPDGSYLPHNHKKDSVVYTGTHDNNTILGWWKKETDENVRSRVSEYLNKQINDDNVTYSIIQSAMDSPANTCILTIQDLLGLDESGRTNTPSTTQGNWEWRLNSMVEFKEISQYLFKITENSGRT